MDNEVKDILRFQIVRGTTNLTKNFLQIIEDLIDEGCPISDEKYTRIRKRALDMNGNTKRDLESFLEKLDVFLKKP